MARNARIARIAWIGSVVAGIALLTAALGCGGDSSSPSACVVTGTWSYSVTPTSNTGGACANVTGGTGTYNITLSGTQYSMVDDGGNTYSGTLDESNCSVAATATITDTSNPNYSITVTDSPSLNFSGNSFSGHGSITLSTNPQQNGTPCTIQYDETGTRQ